MLLELERAEDPNNIPVWSTSNLAMLLFTAPDYEKHKFVVWEYIENVNIHLKPKNIWDSNTLFLINVVGAFLFNDKYFEMANNVVGILLSLRYENWMLESMLKDLHLINTVYTRRKVERKPSVERARFHFWVDYLEQSVTHEMDPDRKKFPVLVSSAASGDDLGKMHKMWVALPSVIDLPGSDTFGYRSISVENHYSNFGRPSSAEMRSNTLGRSSSTEARRNTSRTSTVGSLRSASSQFDDNLTLGSPDVGRSNSSRECSSPLFERKSFSRSFSGAREDEFAHTKIQISSHVPEEVKLADFSRRYCEY